MPGLCQKKAAGGGTLAGSIPMLLLEQSREREKAPQNWTTGSADGLGRSWT